MKGIGRTVKRRRIESKTDYVARKKLLTSGRPRVVVRKTNRYIVAQIVTSALAQDHVVVGVSSADLVGQGWPASMSGSLKSLPAAYLTGLLLAHKAKGSVQEVILDMGMQRNAKTGRIYALVAGLVAGGINVPHNPESLPDQKRLEGNTRTREAFITLKEKLGAHGGKGNKK